MRKPIIAGNWKMNCTAKQAVELAKEIVALKLNLDETDVVLCPPYPFLSDVAAVLENSNIGLGAQNMHAEQSGAFTGEVSAEQLKSVGCRYVILGHSERRALFGESDGIINAKVHTAFRDGLIAIFCVGESLEQRERDQTFEVIQGQIRNGLKGLEDIIHKQADQLVVAYEPVWAIGTGKVASPQQAQDVQEFIRKELASLFSNDIAQSIRLQYGGSVKPENASELLNQPDIDGALVGGASLKSSSFGNIINYKAVNA